jgi:hypothetical protein
MKDDRHMVFRESDVALRPGDPRCNRILKRREAVLRTIKQPPAMRGQYEMVNGQWSMVNGRWSMVDGQWSMVNGQWSMVNGRWLMVNGQWSMVNGQWSMVDGQWVVIDVGIRSFSRRLRCR